MTLALDPRLPLLWRTPDSLQLGVDDPPVVLTHVTTAHEKMLAALAVGLTPEGLTLIGTDSGLSPAQISDFERAIGPALVQPKRVLSCSVEIDGFGATADRLEYRLREAGLEPPRGLPGTTNFAVIVGHYVLDPERRGRWLRRDIPHLPIVFGDTSVTIGPFIEPGAGPCLYCLELHRTDADPAWPAIASQLLGRVGTAESPFLASEAATIATRMVLNRARGGAARSDSVGADPTNAAIAVTVDAEAGERCNQSWRVHPRCACAGITAEVGQYPRETAKGRSVLAADRAMPTTKGEVACVPA